MPGFDRDLLFLYTEDARIKLKDLALFLKKSPQRLKYNISQLEKQKLVHNAHSIIDYSFFGLLLFRVYFKGGYVSEKDKSAILQKLAGHPYIVSVYELSGEFDLVIEIESPNASRFNKQLKRLIHQLPALNNYKIVLNIVTHIYPRSYLIKNSRLLKDQTFASRLDRSIIVGGDREIEKFTKQEMAVLEQVLLHPKTHLSKLATLSDLNIKTLVAVLKGLHKRKILRSFQHLIDTNALEIYKHRLFLKLHNLTSERESELQDYFTKTPEIVQVHKTVGDWDIEVDVEAMEKNTIRYLIVQLREEFTDLIETFNSMEFYQYHDKTFLPQYLFESESKKEMVVPIKEEKK